jgi:hypothetical protein
MFNANLKFEAPNHFGIPINSKGYQLLRDALHWNEESGLGKSEQGRLFPIPTLVKRNRLGLGNPAEKKQNLPLEVVVKRHHQQTLASTNEQQKKRKIRLTKARKKRIEERKKQREKRIHKLIYCDVTLTPEQEMLLYGR